MNNPDIINSSVEKKPQDTNEILAASRQKEPNDLQNAYLNSTLSDLSQ